MRFLVMLSFATVISTLFGSAQANPPPYEGVKLPQAYLDRLAANPRAFQFERGLKDMTERATIARQLANQPMLIELSRSGSSLAAAMAPMLGGMQGNAPPQRIEGTRRIPVILLGFSDSPAPPFTPDRLKQELFDGPWPTGTLTQFFSEVSNGALNVQGSVLPWKSLSKTSSYYAGGTYVSSNGTEEPCYGICPGNKKIGEMIREALDANRGVNWAEFDNNGPDGKPNSGDDDGFVDFVAFVHAGRGAECSDRSPSDIWSHRGNLKTTLGLDPYTTTVKRPNGGTIQIEDYVVFPALACDGTTMIPIGVIAHEFGHAFFLPDLYDINHRSSGLGNWDLMATGAYGGDGRSPEIPTHMSAWSKQFLGWIDVQDIVGTRTISVKPIESSHMAYRVRVSETVNYLISATDRSGFDKNLPASGLTVLQVDESQVKNGLANNTVNSDPANFGVKLIEADGLDRLVAEPFRGATGDPFPGSSGNRSFDSTTTPKAQGGVSICGIPEPSNSMNITISTTGQGCGTAVAAAAPAAPLPAGAQPPPPPVGSGESGTAASLKEGAAVVLKGELTNAGANYFDRRSRKIVLRTESGETVDISTNLPLSTPPGAGPPGGTLAEFLGKKVELKGVVQKQEPGAVAKTVHALDIRVVQ